VSTVGGERVRTFVPALLPPDLEISTDLRRALDAALLALGRRCSSMARTCLPKPRRRGCRPR
jgi:hypothetical protein